MNPCLERFIYLKKPIYRERRRSRVGALPSASSLLKWLQWLKRVNPKPGTWSFHQVSHTGAVTQACGPSITVLPSILAGDSIESGADKTWTGAWMGYQHHRQKLNLVCYSTSPYCSFLRQDWIKQAMPDILSGTGMCKTHVIHLKWSVEEISYCYCCLLKCSIYAGLVSPLSHIPVCEIAVEDYRTSKLTRTTQLWSPEPCVSLSPVSLHSLGS